MRKLALFLFATSISGITLITGCTKEIEENPSKETIYTYVPASVWEEGLEDETQRSASIVWEKIKAFDEAKFVTGEKSYSAVVFIHPYSVGAFNPSTAEWIGIISSIPEIEKEVKIAIFRLDYQTLQLKKVYKFNYPVRKELSLEEAIAIMKEELAKEPFGAKSVSQEGVRLLGGNYIYSYPALDFGGTIIVNKYAAKAIFYAATVWDGTGSLIIPPL